MFKINKLRTILLFLGCLFSSPVSAQIIPDGTLSNNSLVNTVNNQFNIQGGTIRGDNLFHSFEKFNLPNNGVAIFQNFLQIQNIFGRVTGSSISNIDGLIKANGTANLFLINPNGFVFGPNSRLNIGGSFFVSTADNIIFGKDGSFSTIFKNSPPVKIRQNFPSGLGFGSNSGDIVVRGNGHNFKIDIPTSRQSFLNGLRVNPERTLALIGSNIFFEGGNIVAEGGQIKLGSVKNGIVDLKLKSSNIVINYDRIKDFGDIKIDRQSLLDVSSPLFKEKFLSAGKIEIQGKTFELQNGSILFVQNAGIESYGKIKIDASQSVEVKGFFNGFSSRITAESIRNSPGSNIFISSPRVVVADKSMISNNNHGINQGGDINISTKNLELSDNLGQVTTGITSINTLSTNLGAGGKININASQSIDISNPDVNILTLTFGFSDGGELVLNTKNLRINNGARVGSNVFATSIAREFNQAAKFVGKGGNIVINAENIEIIGKSTSFSRGIDGSIVSTIDPSALDSSTFSEANSDKVIIRASRLILKDKAQIRGTTFANGNAADIDIKVNKIVTNNATISVSSEVADLARRRALRLPDSPTGQSGNLNLQVDLLLLENNASITATSASRLGGTIAISGIEPNSPASTISLNNGSAIETNNSTTTDPNRGTIDIFTRNLTLNNNSRIAATVKDSTENPLDSSLNLVGGNINIRATGNIRIDDSSSITASVENRPGGAIDGVNINILGDGNMFLGNNTMEGAAITASVDERGNGGNINIALPNGVLVAIDEADIRANAIEGNGGNIKISAFSILTTPDVNITATSERGVDGTVELDTVTKQDEFGFVRQQKYSQYRVSLRNACISPNNRNSDNSTFNEEKVVPRQENLGEGGSYELRLFVSAEPLPSKTLEDYRVNQGNAVVTTPLGKVYFGKACLINLKPNRSN